MNPFSRRLGQTLLSASVALACVSTAHAATNLSGRYVVETEDGWRLPVLGEDISYAVFYPSWFVGVGGGAADMRGVDSCDYRSVDIGNHFAPKWRWHITGSQCVVEDALDQGFDSANLRVEHLLGDVEATLNTFVGVGLLKRRYDGELPFEEADVVSARLNIGAQLRGKGRWSLRLDHAQGDADYKATSLALVAYLGGGTISDVPAIAVLEGGASTDDSSPNPVARPLPEPTDVVVAATPLDDLPPIDITSGTSTAAEPDAVDITQRASSQPAEPAQPDNPSVSVVPAANVCPPITRPLNSLAFTSSGTLSGQSADELRALAGTLARRDNLIGRVALPDTVGATAAVDSVLNTMFNAEPLIEGRLVVEVIPHLSTAIFELYRIKVGC